MNTEKINPKPIIKKKWTHTPFQKHDLPEIGLFFKAMYNGLGDYGSMGFFHWKIINNYIFPGIINLVKDSNKIISTTSITPKLLAYKDEIINAAEIGDTYTHPDYWRQGLFSLLINQTREDAEKKDIKFIYGTPNKLSLPGYQKRANFDTIKNLNLRSMVFPINLGSKISKRSHWTLGITFGSILSIFSFLYFKAKKVSSIFYKSIIVEEVNEIPSDWDSFWNKASEGFDFILNRNKEAVIWRYFTNPNKYKFMTLRKNKALIGYLVVRIINDDDTRNIIISDYLTLPGEEKLLSIGIDRVMNKAFNISGTQVSTWCAGKSPYFKVFKSVGFFARTTIPVICYQNEFAKQLDGCNSWHFTIGDSDNI